MYQPFILSFKKIRLTILWPILLHLAFGILFAILFFISSGLWNYIINNTSLLSQQNTFTLGFAAKNFISNNTIRVLSAFIIFFTLYFIIGSGLLAIRYGLLKDIIQGKPQGTFKGFWNALPYAQTHFWKTVGMRIITFTIQAIFIGLFITLFITPTLQNISLGIRMLILITLIALSFLLTLALLFRYAYLFLKNDTPVTALYHSLSFFINRPGYTLVVLLILIIATGIRNVLYSFGGYSSLLIPSIILLIIYSLFLALWEDLFIFTAFTHRLPKNQTRQKHS